MPRSALPPDDAGRDARLRHARRQVESVREIGAIPPVVDQERRDFCEHDLPSFLTTYMSETFCDPWSEGHLSILRVLEAGALKGGRCADAVYRGFGKSSIAEGAAMWAVLYGHRRFVPIIGADKDAAKDNLDSIQAGFEASDILLADFPEVCYPIRRLEGIAQRCHGQLHLGKHTHIEWRAETMVLPMIPGSRCAGSIIRCRGITGRIRGMKHKRRDGVTLRPDFVIIDDPQTDISAASPASVVKRLNIIKRAVLKLTGNKTAIAVVCNGTVIEPDDVMDQLLDHERNPAWLPRRIQMVGKMPDALNTLWLVEYAKIRTGYDPDLDGDQGRAHADATAFYVENRAAMDAGCEVSWEHCFNETEVSAIQHAMNILIDDGPEAFASECQQQPLGEELGEGMMSAKDIARKTNGRRAGEVPTACDHITMHIDVHDRLLFYAVVGWQPDDFTGYVLDYGSWPDQKSGWFVMRTAKKTLGKKYPKRGVEGAILAGLEDLLAAYCGREFRRDDAAMIPIGRCLVDRGYKPEIVDQAIRRLNRGPVIMPARGRGVTASNKPFAEYRHEVGSAKGHYWRVPKPTGKEIRFVDSDVNYWKSFIHARLAVGLGDAGCLSVFGAADTRHRLLASHLVAERPVQTEGPFGKVHEWKLPPARPDNHWLDCLVGCAVAASMLGCRLPGQPKPKRRKKTRRRKKASYLE